jgi:hypothetical protein
MSSLLRYISFTITVRQCMSQRFSLLQVTHKNGFEILDEARLQTVIEAM